MALTTHSRTFRPATRLAGAFIGAGLAILVGTAAAHAATLTVTVEGIKSSKGNIEVSIYFNPKEWPDHPTDDHHQLLPAHNSSVVFKFEVPPGTYAAAGYHDENGNGKFDKSFLGLPEEGYLMSNNAKPMLSAPGWDKVKFEVPASGASISMKVVYP